MSSEKRPGTQTGHSDFKVGEWWAHTQVSDLVRDEEVVRVEARSMEVLKCLALHAPKVVSKRRMLEEVWGGAFVSEEVVSHAIWELRRAFSDSARNPQYIETVQRKGYRLLESVAWPSGEAEPRPGARIGQYEVQEVLGSGAMGVVYKAFDSRLGRAVALKFVAQELTRESTARRRFEREARLPATLDHPNIAPIHEIGETRDGRQFLAMAFYSGGTLKERMKDGPLELGAAVSIGKQLALGLAEAHRHGIIHRDVKPANILFSEHGTVKLVDFGIAKLATGTQLTGTGSSLGTPAYKSPEQSRGEAVDHRTDIWSLGVVVYEMLTGTQPFSGSYEHAVVRSILEDDPPLLDSKQMSRFPAHLRRILAKVLDKEPDRRYQSAKELVRDFESLAQGGPQAHAAQKTKSWMGWLIVAAGIAGLALFGISSKHGSRDPFQRTISLESRVATLLDSGRSTGLRGGRREDYELAAAFCRKALEIDPENPRAKAQLALYRIRLERGDIEKEEIAHLIDEAVRDAPDLGLAWVAKARLEQEMGNSETAQQLARAALGLMSSKDPDADLAGVVLGDVLLQLGHYEEGLEVLQEARAVGQGKIRAALMLAFWYERLESPSKATSIYESILESHPEHRLALANLGVIHIETGRFDDSIPLFERAFDLEPTAIIANSLGTAYFFQRSRDLEEAERWFRRAIHLNPGYPNAHGGLGDTYQALGKEKDAETYWKDAVRAFDRELESASAEPQRRALRAVYLAKLSRYEDALGDLEVALSEAPEESGVVFAAAQVYALVGDLEQLCEFVRRAMANSQSLALFKADPCFADFQNVPEFEAALGLRTP